MDGERHKLTHQHQIADFSDRECGHKCTVAHAVHLFRDGRGASLPPHAKRV